MSELSYSIALGTGGHLNIRKKLWTIPALFLLAAVGAPAAHAGTVLFDFTVTGTSTGSGTFTTSTTGTPGQFDITGVTGVFDGITITGLFAPGGYDNNDNVLFSSSPFFDFGGVSFSLASSPFSVNLYYDTGAFYIDSGQNFITDSTSAISVTDATVPEPGTGGLMMGATALLGLLLVKRKRRAPAIPAQG